MDKSRKSTYIIAAISIVVIAVAVYFLFIFKKDTSKKTGVMNVSEDVKELNDVDLTNRPYVTLTPTSDGAEIIISIENMSYFDSIEYELTYLADNPTVPGEKIERGSTGYDVNTAEEKYKKSVLLGTGSKGVRSPDKGVEDGKLTLHFKKGDSEYISETEWNLYQIGKSPETIKSKSGDFQISLPAFSKNYFMILSDTVGLPPLAPFEEGKVAAPVYGTFSIAPSFATSADLSIKTSKEAKDSQLFAYDNADFSWKELKSTYKASSQTLSASVTSFSTFAVVSQ